MTVVGLLLFPFHQQQQSAAAAAAAAARLRWFNFPWSLFCFTCLPI
jgi:hypothetical protein